MRRPVLGRVLLAAVAISACEPSADPSPLPSRVVSVKAKGHREVSLDEFCDVNGMTYGKRAFRIPEVDNAKAVPLEGIRWINVWATWC